MWRGVGWEWEWEWEYEGMAFRFGKWERNNGGFGTARQGGDIYAMAWHGVNQNWGTGNGERGNDIRRFALLISFTIPHNFSLSHADFDDRQ